MIVFLESSRALQCESELNSIEMKYEDVIPLSCLGCFDVETAIFDHVCHKYVVLRHVDTVTS